jgi:hypothetical protein
MPVDSGDGEGQREGKGVLSQLSRCRHWPRLTCSSSSQARTLPGVPMTRACLQTVDLGASHPAVAHQAYQGERQARPSKAGTCYPRGQYACSCMRLAAKRLPVSCKRTCAIYLVTVLLRVAQKTAQRRYPDEEDQR